MFRSTSTFQKLYVFIPTISRRNPNDVLRNTRIPRNPSWKTLI